MMDSTWLAWRPFQGRSSFERDDRDEDLEKCWRRRVWETTRWKQLRGAAGAVVCETRNFVGFPSWHALNFEEGVIVDMKVV